MSTAGPANRQHNATTQALISRQTPAQRPFVLSRSFFAGSQRFSAIWTGDNMGTWGMCFPQLHYRAEAGRAFRRRDSHAAIQ
jgi:alpha-glucosidase (family GH31 glycosyl hydrolase)